MAAEKAGKRNKHQELIMSESMVKYFPDQFTAPLNCAQVNQELGYYHAAASYMVKTLKLFDKQASVILEQKGPALFDNLCDKVYETLKKSPNRKLEV